MKRRLTLKTEHLTELTEQELQSAGGGAFEQFTGQSGCILSLGPCVTVFQCTRLCNIV